MFLYGVHVELTRLYFLSFHKIEQAALAHGVMTREEPRFRVRLKTDRTITGLRRHFYLRKENYLVINKSQSIHQ